MQINLNYTARDKEEFKELATWLRETGVPANTSVNPAKRDRGPNESRFLELSGLSKMRLSEEERQLVESGVMTREQVAAQRVLIEEAKQGGGEMSVAEMQGAQKPEVKVDDGESFVD